MRLFSTEQVSRFHPDKYCDQISDAILDACLEQDKSSRVAVECMAKGKTVILSGEITTNAKVDYDAVVRRVARKNGYEADEIITRISEQSPEIAKGVDAGGAGDQGIMYGYASADTEEYLPYGFAVANEIIRIIEQDVEENGKGSVLSGDAKCMVTVDFDKIVENGKADPSCLNTIVISACHTDILTLQFVREYVGRLLVNEGLEIGNARLIVNPAGAWTVGGPAADCGMTGRKTVCDQYGGYSTTGGGAFSGKDPSKVDRSASYMARMIAVEIMRQSNLKQCSVQLGYSIGMAEPLNILIQTGEGTAFNRRCEEWVRKNYDLTPAGIIECLGLLDRKYEVLAEGCHYRKGMWRY